MASLLERLEGLLENKPMTDYLPPDDPAHTDTTISPDQSTVGKIRKFVDTPMKEYGIPVSDEPIESPFAGGKMPEVPTPSAPAAPVAKEMNPELLNQGPHKLDTSIPLRAPDETVMVNAGTPSTTLATPPAGAPAAPPITPPTSTPQTEDPRWTAFLANLAEQRSAMAAAQGKAQDARDWMDIQNTFRRATDIFLGQKTDEASAQARVNDAYNRPIQAVVQQANLGKELTQAGLSQQDLSDKLAQSRMVKAFNDPNSPESQRAFLLARSQGLIPADTPAGTFTAGQYQNILEGGKAAQENAYRLGELGNTATRNQIDKEHYEREDANRLMEFRMTGGKLPAASAQKIAFVNAASDELDRLEQQTVKSGTGILSGLNAAVNPFSADDKATRDDFTGLAPMLARAESGDAAPSRDAILAAQKELGNVWNQRGTLREKFGLIRQKLVGIVATESRTLQQTGFFRAGGIDVGGGQVPGGSMSIRYQGPPGQAPALLGQQAPQTTGGPAPLYRYSPDRKMRVPTDAAGKPLGPAEANPGG